MSDGRAGDRATPGVEAGVDFGRTPDRPAGAPDAACSGPTTLTIPASADAYVSEASPTTNYGSATTLQTDQTPDYVAYLRFTVAGVTGPVTSAKLRINVINGSAAGPAVYATSSAWQESSVTWNSRPAPTGAKLADTGSIATGWTEVTLTGAALTNGEQALVLVPGSTDGADFSSRESSTAPTLVLVVGCGTSVDAGRADNGGGADGPTTTGTWYRGNTHTHAEFSDTNNTDDTPKIAGWYEAAGYDFLLISEHNDHLATKQTICHDYISTATFQMMCGLELSYSKHVTALGITQYIGNETSLQDAVTRTLGAGGVPIANHPSDSGITAATFLGTTGLNHFEVVNGGRLGDTAAHETLWDAILSAANGRVSYGVASDDNHYSSSAVGRGWIMVRAAALTKTAILDSVRNGDFYATTGVILNDYQVNKAAKTIAINAKNGGTIVFIGQNGTVLKTVTGNVATYQVTGSEKYVRGKVTNSQGQAAWTQPVLVSTFP